MSKARAPLWWELTIDQREAVELQNAANALANAKVTYDRLLAHRTDRLNRLAKLKETQSRDMG